MNRIEKLDPNAFRPVSDDASREVVGGTTASQSTWTKVIDFGPDGEILYSYAQDSDPTPAA